MAGKIPIYTEDDVQRLIAEALAQQKKELETPSILTIIKSLDGVCICDKPRSDGRWCGYFNDKGKKRFVYGTSKEEVACRLKMAMKGGLPQRKKREQNPIPLKIDDFTTFYFDKFRSRKVTTETLKIDTRRYNSYIKPFFKNKEISKIKPSDCQILVDDISAQGKGKTADEVVSLLSCIFKCAIAHDIIHHSPIATIVHTQHERKHGTALTHDEVITLLTSQIAKPFMDVYLLALFTGLRPNEYSTAVRDGNFIVAKNSKRKNKKVQYKKIPIAKEFAPFVKDSYSVNYELLRLNFKSIFPEHKLYDMRVTFYSRCKECNISDNAISEFVGHSLGALGNTYTDLSDEFLLKEGAKFSYNIDLTTIIY